jgi:ring-1,2-phenylacetyl-CoA epoxidase subunit PaaE
MSPTFNFLTVSRVDRLTDDALTLGFQVPPELHDAYLFTQGQYITFNAVLDGETLRRSYSLCVSPQQYAANGELRVGIKAVTAGKFSQWVNNTVAVGDRLEVMTPDGKFFSHVQAAYKSAGRHYACFAGGSGITPILSIVQAILAAEPDSHCSLIYGNRTVGSIMFLEEIAALKNSYLDRLQVIHVISDEAQDIALLHGLLDESRCRALLTSLVNHHTVDDFFICGPGPMMDAAEAALHGLAVDKKRIHIERFGPSKPSAPPVVSAVNATDCVPVDIILDGSTRRVFLAKNGQSVLNAGLAAGLNLPFACKAGVCCTCRAKVISGSVRMDANYTLQDDEMAAGFVLTCQSHPTSEALCVSYDER